MENQVQQDEQQTVVNVHETNISHSEIGQISTQRIIADQINHVHTDQFVQHIHVGPHPPGQQQVQPDTSSGVISGDFREYAQGSSFLSSGATSREKSFDEASTKSLSDADGCPCTVYKDKVSSGLSRNVYKKVFKGIHAKKFVDYFNKRTLQQTEVNITESYKEQKLQEPDFIVNPQIRKVDRFYKGEMAPGVTEYKIEPSLSLKANDVEVGSFISLHDLVMELAKKDLNRIALIGQAGSGKTTTMKRLVQVVYELQQDKKGNLFIINEESTDDNVSTKTPSVETFSDSIATSENLTSENSLAETFSIEDSSRKPLANTSLHKRKKLKYFFLFIHHMSIKDILSFKGNGRDEAISPCDLLFGGNNSELSRQDLEGGYEWVKKHQSRCILLLDGLDQATWSLHGVHNNMEYHDKSGTGTIMYNFIARKLFPDMTIVISSREHRIASLSYELRPSLIIALAGLNSNDIKRLFIAVVGENGEQTWEKLVLQSPALVSFSSVPLFLIFNAIVHKFNPENPPNTITEVILQILHIFMRSGHTLEKQIVEILRRLMKMSFEGTQEKRVIFNIKDLRKVKIHSEEVRDIIIKVPGNNMINQHLMEGDHLMFFSHQILQEVLTALYIADMEPSKFHAFITNNMRADHWGVVLRLLGGAVLNPDIEQKFIQDFSDVARYEEKKNILRAFLKTQISKSKLPYQQLNLFGTLYEANDVSLIRSAVKRIDFVGASLTEEGIYAMSSVMRQCSQLDLLRLAKCGLTGELFRRMEKNLIGSELKVTELDISGNTMYNEYCSAFSAFLSHIDICKLTMQYCELTVNGFRKMQQHSGSKIHTLDVRFNGAMTSELYHAIASFAKYREVEELFMDRWNIFKANENIVSTIFELKVLGKVNMFDISGVKNLGPAGFAKIGSIVSRCQPKVLRARECNLTSTEMESLRQNISDIKLMELNVSGNKRLGTNGFGEVGSVASLTQTKVLSAWECNLTAEGIKTFRENTKNATFDELLIGGNTDLGKVGFGEIGLVTSQCQVRKLNACECNLTAREIKAFKENTRNAKMDTLVISGNKNLGTDGFAEFGLVVSQCQIKKVSAQECDVTAYDLRAFQENTRDIEIKRLDLSWNNVVLMGQEGLFAISDIVHQCKVQKLKMYNCKWNTQHLKIFKKSINDININFKH
uniref:uncharacterized protein LOC120326500 isoform X1 n=2 Tax=Styela clava TaxID=7725 RepID=UPI00193A9F85|nr:uncharacterized protein LOC120326500 isoform X1 [Styela clava]